MTVVPEVGCIEKRGVRLATNHVSYLVIVQHIHSQLGEKLIK